MNPAEQADSERFFEVLAGREGGMNGAEHLRVAILAEARTLQEADKATAADIPAVEMQRLDDLKAQLLASGVFSALPTASANADTSPQHKSGGLMAWLKEVLATHRLAPLAVAATVTLALLVTYQQQLESPSGVNEADVVRGGEEIVLRVDNPPETVGRIQRALEQQGIEVIAVQLNDRMWAIQVNPANLPQKEAAKAALTELGVKTNGAWPFKLRISDK